MEKEGGNIISQTSSDPPKNKSLADSAKALKSALHPIGTRQKKNIELSQQTPVENLQLKVTIDKSRLLFVPEVKTISEPKSGSPNDVMSFASNTIAQKTESVESPEVSSNIQQTQNSFSSENAEASGLKYDPTSNIIHKDPGSLDVSKISNTNLAQKTESAESRGAIENIQQTARNSSPSEDPDVSGSDLTLNIINPVIPSSSSTSSNELISTVPSNKTDKANRPQNIPFPEKTDPIPKALKQTTIPAQFSSKPESRKTWKVKAIPRLPGMQKPITGQVAKPSKPPPDFVNKPNTSKISAASKIEVISDIVLVGQDVENLLQSLSSTKTTQLSLENTISPAIKVIQQIFCTSNKDSTEEIDTKEKVDTVTENEKRDLAAGKLDTEEIVKERIGKDALFKENLTTENLATEDLITEKLVTNNQISDKLTKNIVKKDFVKVVKIKEKLVSEDLQTERLKTEFQSSEDFEKIDTELIATEEPGKEDKNTEDLITEDQDTDNVTRENQVNEDLKSTKNILPVKIVSEKPTTTNDSDSSSSFHGFEVDEKVLKSNRERARKFLKKQRIKKEYQRLKQFEEVFQLSPVRNIEQRPENCYGRKAKPITIEPEETGHQPEGVQFSYVFPDSVSKVVTEVKEESIELEILPTVSKGEPSEGVTTDLRSKRTHSKLLSEIKPEKSDFNMKWENLNSEGIYCIQNPVKSRESKNNSKQTQSTSTEIINKIKEIEFIDIIPQEEPQSESFLNEPEDIKPKKSFSEQLRCTESSEEPNHTVFIVSYVKPEEIPLKSEMDDFESKEYHSEQTLVQSTERINEKSPSKRIETRSTKLRQSQQLQIITTSPEVKLEENICIPDKDNLKIQYLSSNSTKKRDEPAEISKEPQYFDIVSECIEVKPEEPSFKSEADVLDNPETCSKQIQSKITDKTEEHQQKGMIAKVSSTKSIETLIPELVPKPKISKSEINIKDRLEKKVPKLNLSTNRVKLRKRGNSDAEVFSKSRSYWKFQQISETEESEDSTEEESSSEEDELVTIPKKVFDRYISKELVIQDIVKRESERMQKLLEASKIKLEKSFYSKSAIEKVLTAEKNQATTQDSVLYRDFKEDLNNRGSNKDSISKLGSQDNASELVTEDQQDLTESTSIKTQPEKSRDEVEKSDNYRISSLESEPLSKTITKTPAINTTNILSNPSQSTNYLTESLSKKDYTTNTTSKSIDDNDSGQVEITLPPYEEIIKPKPASFISNQPMFEIPEEPYTIIKLTGQHPDEDHTEADVVPTSKEEHSEVESIEEEPQYEDMDRNIDSSNEEDECLDTTLLSPAFEKIEDISLSEEHEIPEPSTSFIVPETSADFNNGRRENQENVQTDFATDIGSIVEICRGKVMEPCEFRFICNTDESEYNENMNTTRSEGQSSDCNELSRIENKQDFEDFIEESILNTTEDLPQKNLQLIEQEIKPLISTKSSQKSKDIPYFKSQSPKSSLAIVKQAIEEIPETNEQKVAIDLDLLSIQDKSTYKVTSPILKCELQENVSIPVEIEHPQILETELEKIKSRQSAVKLSMPQPSTRSVRRLRKEAPNLGHKRRTEKAQVELEKDDDHKKVDAIDKEQEETILTLTIGGLMESGMIKKIAVIEETEEVENQRKEVTGHKQNEELKKPGIANSKKSSGFEQNKESGNFISKQSKSPKDRKSSMKNVCQLVNLTITELEPSPSKITSESTAIPKDDARESCSKIADETMKKNTAETELIAILEDDGKKSSSKIIDETTFADLQNDDNKINNKILLNLQKEDTISGNKIYHNALGLKNYSETSSNYNFSSYLDHEENIENPTVSSIASNHRDDKERSISPIFDDSKKSFEIRGNPSPLRIKLSVSKKYNRSSRRDKEETNLEEVFEETTNDENVSKSTKSKRTLKRSSTFKAISKPEPEVQKYLDEELNSKIDLKQDHLSNKEDQEPESVKDDQIQQEPIEKQPSPLILKIPVSKTSKKSLNVKELDVKVVIEKYPFEKPKIDKVETTEVIGRTPILRSMSMFKEENSGPSETSTTGSIQGKRTSTRNKSAIAETQNLEHQKESLTNVPSSSSKPITETSTYQILDNDSSPLKMKISIPKTPTKSTRRTNKNTSESKDELEPSHNVVLETSNIVKSQEQFISGEQIPKANTKQKFPKTSQIEDSKIVQESLSSDQDSLKQSQVRKLNKSVSTIKTRVIFKITPKRKDKRKISIIKEQDSNSSDTEASSDSQRSSRASREDIPEEDPVIETSRQSKRQKLESVSKDNKKSSTLKKSKSENTADLKVTDEIEDNLKEIEPEVTPQTSRKRKAPDPSPESKKVQLLMDGFLKTSKAALSKQIRICGNCKAEVGGNKWRAHVAKHNGLAWRESLDPPMNLKDKATLISVLTLFMKENKLKELRCEKCRETRKSVVGFISHKHVCGLTPEEQLSRMATCEHCHHKMKPSSMPTHLRSHCSGLLSKNTPEVEIMESSEESIEFTDSGRMNRKSKHKALKKLSDLVKEKVDVNYEDLIIKPKITGGHLSRWNGKEQRGEDLSCLADSCNFTCKKVASLLVHNKMCLLVKRLNFKCRLCKYSNVNYENMKDHVLADHSKSTPLGDVNEPNDSESEASRGQESSDSEQSSGVSEEEAETPEEEDDGDDGERGPRKKSSSASNTLVTTTCKNTF